MRADGDPFGRTAYFLGPTPHPVLRIGSVASRQVRACFLMGRKIGDMRNNEFSGYWIKVPDELIELLHELPPAELKAYLAVQRFIQKDKHPGEVAVRPLAKLIGLKSVGHTNSALNRLCERGLLKAKKANRRTTVYSNPMQWRGKLDSTPVEHKCSVPVERDCSTGVERHLESLEPLEFFKSLDSPDIEYLGQNTDLDLLTTNRKGRDSRSADESVCPSRIKKYPLLREALFHYFREPGQEDLYPSDRIVVDVMEAAKGATESGGDCVPPVPLRGARAFTPARERGPGTGHGSRRWWRTTSAKDANGTK